MVPSPGYVNAGSTTWAIDIRASFSPGLRIPTFSCHNNWPRTNLEALGACTGDSCPSMANTA